MPGSGFWKSKPPPGVPLDWGHPLVQGLVCAFPYNEGGGVPVDHVTERIPEALPTIDPYAWTARSPYGVTFDPKPGASGTVYLIGTTLRPIINKPLTIALGYTPRATDQWLYSIGSAGGLRSLIHCRINSTSLDFNLWVDDLNVTGVTNATDEFMSFICRLADDGTQSIYKNGAFVGSRAAGGLYAGTDRFDIGRRIDQGGSANGHFSYFYVWDRALSEQEIAELHADPYQMFAPPVWRRYFVPAGGAPAATLRRYSLPLTGVG